MITSTLKGIFPEPKPSYRRNFIRENVSRIKQMQGLLPVSDPELPKKRKDDKFRNIPSKTVSKTNSAHIQNNNKTSGVVNSKVGPESQRPSTNHSNNRTKENISKIKIEKQKFLSRGIQTERLDDMSKLYESGVIKYPSAGVRRSPKKKFSGEQGDNSTNVDELFEAADNLDLNDKTEHNYIKENIKSVKAKTVNKFDTSPNPTQPPPGYQKGVVPKYLKDRRGNEKSPEIQPDCPPGHVLLPEEERKETLRVLRQSYADRVQELNSLPVRSDTLKMKKRKMDIEEELKKIDEGIKVFQRPKVFVKINA